MGILQGARKFLERPCWPCTICPYLINKGLSVGYKKMHGPKTCLGRQVVIFDHFGNSREKKRKIKKKEEKSREGRKGIRGQN